MWFGIKTAGESFLRGAGGLYNDPIPTVTNHDRVIWCRRKSPETSDHIFRSAAALFPDDHRDSHFSLVHYLIKYFLCAFPDYFY